MLIKRIFKNFGSSHKIDLTHDYYNQRYNDVFQKLYNNSQLKPLSQCLTQEGSQQYLQRQSTSLSPNAFGNPLANPSLSISTLGIGTYKGDHTQNINQFNAIVDSVFSGGINHIDTALNFRYQQSERVVGCALQFLNEQNVKRNELFISTKHGYIPEDWDNKLNRENIIKSILLSNQNKQCESELQSTQLGYSLEHTFLQDYMQKSLSNLNVEMIDLIYLQNPEILVQSIGIDKTYEKIQNAFSFYEQQKKNKRIQFYGISSWNCFRQNILSVDKLFQLAVEVGGQDHGFRFIQSPFNVMMTELLHNLEFKSAENKVNLITSSPLLQGTLSQIPLPSSVFGCSYMGSKHLQFIRSAQLNNYLSTVIGMKTNRHVKQNLEIIQYDNITPDQFKEFIMTVKIQEQNPEYNVDQN